MVFVDAHVHIYDCYHLPRFFDATHQNITSAARQIGCQDGAIAVLLLAESACTNWFERLKLRADAGESDCKNKIGGWAFATTREKCSIIAQASGDKKIILISGRQIVTAEKLEVLALATDSSFPDGEAINELIHRIRALNGIVVIPWGFGKWTGRRGKKLQAVMDAIEDPLIMLGENGGRPNLFLPPSAFKRAQKDNIRILPGSDPLPFKSEANKAGSLGFVLTGDISVDFPASHLKSRLSTGTEIIQSFGESEKLLRFLVNQARMQLRKHKLI